MTDKIAQTTVISNGYIIEAQTIPRPISEYSDGMGPVVWWRWDNGKWVSRPYIGAPRWTSNYFTHFTHFTPLPNQPAPPESE